MTKYATIDELLETLYDCISGPPGGQDWERDREIYHPRCVLVRTRIEEGKAVAYPFSFDEFMAATIPMLEGKSFYEIELGRKVEIFGQVAHVYSSYEARETPDHPEIQFRGVNMIHLWNDGIGSDGKPDGRWWIMGMIWDNEREGLELPAEWMTR